MGEPRRQDRIRTFLKAQIRYNRGASMIDCVIKNISETGARIEITAAVTLPAEFDLCVPNREKTYRAKMVWRDEGTMGVHFLEEISATPAARAESAIEIENVKLRAQVRELTKRLEDLGQDVSWDRH